MKKESSTRREQVAPLPEHTFEEAMKRLEAIVGDLERGEIPLEESLRIFEEGIALSRFCFERLKTAEGKIQKLIEGADGTLSLEPFALNGKET